MIYPGVRLPPHSMYPGLRQALHRKNRKERGTQPATDTESSRLQSQPSTTHTRHCSVGASRAPDWLQAPPQQGGHLGSTWLLDHWTGSPMGPQVLRAPGFSDCPAEFPGQVWMRSHCLRRGVRASGPSQERTGESGAFGLWPHPRGSSRISS